MIAALTTECANQHKPAHATGTAFVNGEFTIGLVFLARKRLAWNGREAAGQRWRGGIEIAQPQINLKAKRIRMTDAGIRRKGREFKCSMPWRSAAV